jgi:polysaccharide export outer membrane protein
VVFALSLPFLLSPSPASAQTNSSAPSVTASPIATNANLYTTMDVLDNAQKLGIGDHVSFRVIEDKEDSKQIVVTDSGELDIPYLGRVKAAEKTCQSMAKEIKVALEKELYYKATVIVAIDQLNKKRGSVYLVGQVRTSGAVEIPSDEVFTVSKAILRAGGFGDFADKKHVKVTRKVEGEPAKVFIVDLAEILEKGQTDKDAKLEPGDLIFIPSRLINF